MCSLINWACTLTKSEEKKKKNYDKAVNSNRLDKTRYSDIILRN